MSGSVSIRRSKPVYFDEARFGSLFRSRCVEGNDEREIPQGWSKAAPDPMALLAGCPHLRIRPGLVLRAYQYHSGGNGNAIVWAMPADAPFPEPGECEPQEQLFASAPRPAGALDGFMEAIAADDTEEGYVSASIFERDCAELGAMWHGCGWSTHTILFSDPLCEEKDEKLRFRTRRGWPPEMPRTGWEWTAPRPRRWQPRFSRGKHGPTVTFHTRSGLGRDTIYRHVDVYPSDGRLVSRGRVMTLAFGPGGFVF